MAYQHEHEHEIAIACLVPACLPAWHGVPLPIVWHGMGARAYALAWERPPMSCLMERPPYHGMARDGGRDASL